MRSITLVLLFTISTAFAQENPVYLSVCGGPGIGYLSGNEYVSINQSIRSAPSIGIITEFFITEKVSVTTGMNFVKKGAWDVELKYVKANNTYITNSYTNDYKYLNIPFMIGFSSGSKLKFISGFGFYTAILLQHIDVYDLGIAGLKIKETNTADYKSFDMGLAASLGLALPINDNTMFFLMARHNLGLLNTFNYELEGGGSLKTNLTEFLVGARILLN